MSRFRPVFLSLIALGFAALSACDKVALLAPTGSTLTLSINTTTVPINGTAIVKASVIEAGNTPVHDGTTVTFTASFGTIEPTEAQTQGGVATVTFRGTSSGTAKISAFSGSAKAEITDVKVGGAAAGTVAMRSTPSSLPQGGGTVDIFAIVRDASGNLLPGAPVSFTTDQGNLSSTAAISDANGEAKVSLTTNRDTVVTATVIAGVTATTNVRIINAPTVTITSTTTTPGVGVGVNFTVTPGAVTSGAPIQSASVNWGDGSAVQNLGAISGATNVTHIFNQPGIYTVTASVVDATGQGTSSTISVNVQRIAPTVSFAGTPSATGTVGSVLAFNVTAAPGTGGPPIQNVRVVISPGGSVLFTGSTGGGFTHQFTSAGVYTLTATATDTSGTTGTATHVVTITGFEIALDAISTPALTCAGTPKVCTGLAAGANVTFTATVTTAGVTTSSYTWKWGDGKPDETTTARVNSHVYTSAAVYGVEVTVTTTTGATASQIITIRP